MTADLISQLGSATEGSRELDALIEDVIDPLEPDEDGARSHSEFMGESEFEEAVGRYTTSLDAALALAERVLPHWTTDVHTSPPTPTAYPIRKDFVMYDDGDCEVTISYQHPNLEPREIGNGFAKTPALALCIAILEALRSLKEPVDEG